MFGEKGDGMATLDKYRNMRIVISAADAQRILQFIFPNAQPVPVASIDQNDIRFAQALIVEAAEASARIGFIQSLWEKAVSPTARPMGLVKTIVKSALRYLNRPTTVQQAADSPDYQMVLYQIANNFGSVWRYRVQTGDTTMLF